MGKGEKEMNLSWQLHEISKNLPQKTAYIFNGQSCSYAELDASITKFAAGLQSLGIKKGDHVALLLGNSPQFIISLYGVLRVGATAIPINPIYTPDEISYIVMNGDVKAVIAAEPLLPLVEKIDTILPSIQHFIICEATIDNEPPVKINNEKMKSLSGVMNIDVSDFSWPQLDSDETAVILYTSGTTGKPKGAMLTHQNLYRNARDTWKIFANERRRSHHNGPANVSCVLLNRCLKCTINVWWYFIN